MTPPALRDLLADTLALWGVAGRVAVDEAGVVIEAGSKRLRVRPADPREGPIRWWMTRDGRERPCPSVLGLLRALRNALGAPGPAPARLRFTALP
ncbi:MAG TPA: hypothetical protein VD970_02980 [Acetobacteraceae bacterium]|nr:hypothetical protein [Acetobacteraceae bacterium]